jgi:hypothetical protein
MKVERKESEFKPIVITLESQEEVESLWRILDCRTNVKLDEYMQCRDNYLLGEMRVVKSNLLRALGNLL